MPFSDVSTPRDVGALLERVPKATLRAHIVERLRVAILAGDIPPGAPLVETALSERFDVSRGPLREALRQLIEEGLVVTVPYTGTHVAELSVEDVQEIYSLRTVLETFAFEQVWPRRDDRFRAELKLYWAAHHRAHGRRGPKRDSHDSYIKAAFGTEFEAMKIEIADHMRRGVETTEKFLRMMPNLSGKSKRGDNS